MRDSFVTIQASILPKLFQHRLARPGRGLAICAVLSCLVLLSMGASAQTSAPVPSANATALTAANPDQRPDSAIAEDINTKLMASNTLRPLDLGIWVHDGTATLTGTVPTQELRTEAEDMVKSVTGVKNVEDKITIGAAPAAAPGFSGQNGEGANAVHPGDAQGPPPPPPPAGYEENEGAPSPQSPESPQSPPSPQSPSAENYSLHQPAGTVTIESGTPAYVMVMQPIDSKHTKIGTPFHGILVRDIVEQNGVIAIPRGADISGTVVDARGPGKLKGHPQLALQLTGVEVVEHILPADQPGLDSRWTGKGRTIRGKHRRQRGCWSHYRRSSRRRTNGAPGWFAGRAGRRRTFLVVFRPAALYSCGVGADLLPECAGYGSCADSWRNSPARFTGSAICIWAARIRKRVSASAGILSSAPGLLSGAAGRATGRIPVLSRFRGVSFRCRILQRRGGAFILKEPGPRVKFRG